MLSLLPPMLCGLFKKYSRLPRAVSASHRANRPLDCIVNVRRNLILVRNGNVECVQRDGNHAIKTDQIREFRSAMRAELLDGCLISQLRKNASVDESRRK